MSLTKYEVTRRGWIAGERAAYVHENASRSEVESLLADSRTKAERQAEREGYAGRSARWFIDAFLEEYRKVLRRVYLAERDPRRRRRRR